MFDKHNHNNSCCDFAEQTIAFLYDEVNSSEKAVFETHLKSCATCADEIAGFEAIRSSVLEWRNEEFSSLELPVIKIPYRQTRTFGNSDADSNVSRWWTAELRRLFSFSPAFAATATLALIALFAGIAIFTAKHSDKSGIARIDNRNDNKTIASSTIDKESAATATGDFVKETAAEISPKNGVKPFGSDDRKVNRQTNTDSKVVRKDSVLKIADDSRIAAKNFKQETNSPRVKALNIENKKSFSARTGKIPRLNNVEDEEDKSLRLAELLDEADDK